MQWHHPRTAPTTLPLSAETTSPRVQMCWAISELDQGPSLSTGQIGPFQRNDFVGPNESWAEEDIANLLGNQLTNQPVTVFWFSMNHLHHWQKKCQGRYGSLSVHVLLQQAQDAFFVSTKKSERKGQRQHWHARFSFFFFLEEDNKVLSAVLFLFRSNETSMLHQYRERTIWVPGLDKNRFGFGFKKYSYHVGLKLTWHFSADYLLRIP